MEANALEYKYLAFGNLENKVGSWNGGDWIAGTHSSGTTSGAGNGNTTLVSGPGFNMRGNNGTGTDFAEGGLHYDTFSGFHGMMFSEKSANPGFGGDFTTANTFLRCDMDGGTVVVPAQGLALTLGRMSMMRFARTPLIRGKTLWNGESTLIPMHVYLNRASETVSRLGSVGHMRLVRLDNFENGDIITLGQDRWMVLPVFKRDLTLVQGKIASFNSFDGHSGGAAYAIKYDGP